MGRRTAPPACACGGIGGSANAGETAGMEAWTRLSEELRARAIWSVRLAGGGGDGSLSTCFGAAPGGTRERDRFGRLIHRPQRDTEVSRGGEGEAACGEEAGQAGGIPCLPDEDVLALAQPVQLDEGAEVDAVLVADLPEGLAGADLRGREGSGSAHALTGSLRSTGRLS